MTRKAPLSIMSLRGLTTFRQAFQLALDLHPPTQQPVDMSYGLGNMYRGIRCQPPLRCDVNNELELDVCADWSSLPSILGPHTRELLIADPIFVDDVGPNSTHRRYARRSSGPAADVKVIGLLEQVMTVGRELLVPRGTFLLKIGEQNHSN